MNYKSTKNQKIFYGQNYNINILNLDVYITNRCNFKCNYCYKGLSNNQDITFKNCIKSINFIKSVNYTVIPCMLGGEPLLNIKTLNFLINEYNKLKNVKYISVTTNGSKTIKDVDKNVKFIFSYHYQYYDKIKNTFLQNINYCINNNIEYLISVQIDDNVKIPNELLNYNLYVNPITNNKFNIKIYDKFLSIYNINDKKFNEREIINLKLNSFLNQKCYLRWYNFNIDGTITPGCGKFQNELTNYVACPYKYCSCGVSSLENLKCINTCKV